MPLPHLQSSIPLFDRKSYHSFVPTKVSTATARSGGPGRPLGRRNSASPWTGASTVAGSLLSVRRSLLFAVAASLVLTNGGAAMAGTSLSVPPPPRRAAVVPFDSLVMEASDRFQIPASWIRGVIQIESAGVAHAVSPKGAMGLMQLMPDTWSALRLRYHLGSDPFDPRDNIFGGTAYLRELFDRFGASGFLAAYNAGPKRFEDYLAGLRPLHDETRRYVSRLARALPDLHMDGAAIVEPAAEDWRTGGLFSTSPSASTLSNGTPSDANSSNNSAQHGFVLAPQSGGLFVAVLVVDQL